MHGAEILPKTTIEDVTTSDTPDYRAVLDALAVPVYATDAKGIVTYCNAAAAALAGASRSSARIAGASVGN